MPPWQKLPALPLRALKRPNLQATYLHEVVRQAKKLTEWCKKLQQLDASMPLLLLKVLCNTLRAQGSQSALLAVRLTITAAQLQRPAHADTTGPKPAKQAYYALHAKLRDVLDGLPGMAPPLSQEVRHTVKGNNAQPGEQAGQGWQHAAGWAGGGHAAGCTALQAALPSRCPAALSGSWRLPGSCWWRSGNCLLRSSCCNLHRPVRR